MSGVVFAPKQEDDVQTDDSTGPVPVPPPAPVVTISTEQLARLERFATANALAAGFSHEIANPLSCLMAALGALDVRMNQVRGRGAVSPTELDQFASDVELALVSGNEMFALVRDFQTFLKPPTLETVPAIDLKPAIVRALRMARPRLGVRSPVSVALADAPAVRIPSSRVTQIVLNLLLNAADALAARPWSANLVEVRLDTVEHWAVIEVKDNGPGIDPETRNHLFEVGTSTNRTATSMGLGLAICRALARAAGGEISVSSPIAAGTLFRVVLPPALGVPGQRPSAV